MQTVQLDSIPSRQESATHERGLPDVIPAQLDQPALWRDGLFWLTLALTLFAVAPFLQPGYHWGANDARHHVYFLFEMDRVLQDGVWWPRWSPDFTFGYGYPFFNIYGPLSHFIATFFLRVIGLSYTGAVEAVFCVSIVGSAAAMYAFMRSWTGRHAALIAALVYVYAPYHLLNLYVRANLAESMAFVWLPLCLWTLRECVVRPSVGRSLPFGWIVGLGVSLAGLLLTSQLVTLIFMPLFGLYFLVLLWVHGAPDTPVDLTLPPGVRIGQWLRHSVPRLIAPILGGLIALGLSCIFWLPMLLEYGDVRVDQWYDGRYDFHGDFVYFFQLFSPRWGFGSSQPGPGDPIGFQIGAAPLLLAAMGVLLLWPRLGRQRWAVACFAVVGVGATVVGMQIAAPLWDLPFLGSILGAAQFPWRWFNLTTVCVSVLAGLVVHPLVREIPAPRLTLALLALIAVVLLSSYPYLRVEITEPVEGPVGLPALMRFQRQADEMTGSTRWVDPIPMWSAIASEYLRREAENPDEPVQPISSWLDNTDEQMDYTPDTGHVAHSVAHNTMMEEVWYFSGVEDWAIIFNHFYYPGWKAYLLDSEHGEPVRELDIIPGEAVPEAGIPSGRMTVPVPPGEGYVLLRFEDTPPRTIGRAVSLATLGLVLVLGVIVVFRRRTRMPKQRSQESEDRSQESERR